jgi:glutathione S-transferase
MPKEASFAALVTAIALIMYFVVTLNVGRARAKYNVLPPNTTGNPNFERVLRVQQNTLEQIVPFLPALWLFSLLVDPKIGAGLGGVWIVGRILYAWGYYQAAEKRGPGFGIAFLAQIALVLGSLYGAVMNVMH